jgi:hypothetical protein
VLACAAVAGDERRVAFRRSVFHAAYEHKGRAAPVIAIDRALGDAEFFGLNIVPDKNLVGDADALGMKLPAARIERLLVDGVHFTSPLCVKR